MPVKPSARKYSSARLNGESQATFLSRVSRVVSSRDPKGDELPIGAGAQLANNEIPASDSAAPPAKRMHWRLVCLTMYVRPPPRRDCTGMDRLPPWATVTPP